MAAADTQKLKVFISYSRDDLAFADQLFAGLEATGFAPTLDRVGISAAADWRETLRAMIVKCDTVVFVLSPSSARSPMCAEEVAIADSAAKRIIPVVALPLHEAPVPKRLQDLNYIFFYPEPKAPGSGVGDGLRKLKYALETNQDWMRDHTRYTDRAMEWDTGSRKPERLLSGTDIAQAQGWVRTKPLYAPNPTVLQIAYIDASAAAEVERAAAQAARDATERDKEIKRITAEREAERLRFDAARIEAERTAAQAESRRRRSQLLISLPALLVATGGLSGWYIQGQQRQLADEHAGRLLQEKQLAESQKLVAELQAGKLAAIAAGPAGRGEDNSVNDDTVTRPGERVRPTIAQADPPRPTRAPSTTPAGEPHVSQEAADLIIAFEIGDRANYSRRFGSPIWPGAASGVVIGIGYDLGYVSAEQFAADWKSSLSAADFERLLPFVGIKGKTAGAAIASLSDVHVSYEAALAFYSKTDLVKFEQQTMAAFPGADKLPPDSFGALVSLVFNRGSGLSGDKRIEMRNIHDLIIQGDYAAVPNQFRAMKRLWPDIPGLQKRRDAEATLFEKGLAQLTVTR